MLEFLFTKTLGKAALVGVLVAVLIVGWQIDRASQRHIGRLDERINTEKANEDAVKQADDVGARSRDPRVGGVRDPYAGPEVR